jgi:malonyl-CoA/methylmalonyl-CoA synthetase
MKKSLFFEENLAKGGVKKFIETEKNGSYTYLETEIYTNQIANFLKNEGLKKGDRICIIATKSPATIFYYLAILKIGGVYTPISPDSNIGEIDYILEDTEASALIFPSSAKSFILNNSRNTNTVKYLEQINPGLKLAFSFSPFFKNKTPTPSDTALILYTSGTTGKPKGVILDYAQITRLESLITVWKVRETDKIFLALQLSHIHGIMLINISLHARCGLFLYPNPFSQDTIKILQKVSIVSLSPTHYKILNELFKQTPIRNPIPRLFINGSNSLPNKTAEDFKIFTKKNIVNRYGSTELGIHTTNIPDKEVLGSCGKPLSDLLMRIVDDNGKILPPGVIGNIEVKSPHMFSGYWRNKEKTSQSITPDGFFKTGDIGKFDKNKNLFITSRAIEVITGEFGFKIYPKEIESYIEEIEGLEEIAVIGIPSKDNYEKISLFVSIKKGFEKVLPPEVIKNLIAKKVSRKKIPSCVHILDSLPKNKAGKITKEELKKIHLTFPLH